MLKNDTKEARWRKIAQKRYDRILSAPLREQKEIRKREVLEALAKLGELAKDGDFFLPVEPENSLREEATRADSTETR